jgi:hypothetical protein
MGNFSTHLILDHMFTKNSNPLKVGTFCSTQKQMDKYVTG